MLHVHYYTRVRIIHILQCRIYGHTSTTTFEIINANKVEGRLIQEINM